MNDLLKPVLPVLPAIFSATILTLVIALISMVLAMVFAIPAGFGRLSSSPVIRSVATTYVELIRGTPLLFQILIWYYGVRTLLLVFFGFNPDVEAYNFLTTLNSNNLFPQAGVSNFFFAVFALGFNYGAYLAEVIRAGILAVDHGQTEAAQTLGLSGFQASRLIVLPQALRLMVPPLTNNLITLVQDTAFVQAIGVFELSVTMQSQVLATSNPAIRGEFYLIELLIYFAICYSLSLVGRRFESSAAPRRSFVSRMFGGRPRVTVQA